MPNKTDNYTPQYDPLRDDIREFESIFNFFYEKVRRFALGLTKESAVADEIANSVFIKLWIKRKEIDWSGNISGYIFTITKNEVNYYFRLKSKLRKYSCIDIALQCKDEARTDDSILLQDINSSVDACLKSMPEQRRKIFAMSRIDMLSNDEIAQKLGLSKRTIEKHMSLALKTLRNYLGNFGFWIFIYFL